jgi:hypothetical protein
MTDPSDRARYGWTSDFPTFRDTAPRVVRGRLQDFIRDASPEQVRAWDDAIPKLQTEVRQVLDADADASAYTAILEYELPLDARRPDVVLLVSGAIVVLELKGKTAPSEANLDQAAAYARDLRCHHRACADREVHAVVVPTRARGSHGVRSGVHVVGPDHLDTEIRFHLATDLDRFVEGILSLKDPPANRELAVRLDAAGYHLRLTRRLDEAKDYLRERYAEHPLARYGLLLSSRDKSLAAFGVDPGPGFGSRKPPLGPWYGDGDESPASCRRLTRAATEFDAQGLELDAVLLAWGTDLMLVC